MKKLHVPPKKPVTFESPDDEYSIMRSRLDAYSTLISVSGAKEQSPPQSVIDKVNYYQVEFPHLTGPYYADDDGIDSPKVSTKCIRCRKS